MSGRDEFSVCQFFADGRWEYVRRFVSAAEAFTAARTYTTNPAAQMGITKRVIITDGGDNICLEWQHGLGVTFPKRPKPEETSDAV